MAHRMANLNVKIVILLKELYIKNSRMMDVAIVAMLSNRSNFIAVVQL